MFPLRFLTLTGLLLIVFQAICIAEGNENKHMEILDNQRALKIGDRMSYQVIEEREPPIIVFVNARGEVNAPLIDPIPAKGKTLQTLAYEIKSRLEVDYFHRATVVLQYPRINTSRGTVDIAGAVQNPNSYSLPSDQILTVSSALALAGGMTADSDGTQVNLVRGSREGSQPEAPKIINIRQIMDSGEFDKDLTVQDGDLIIVPRSAQAAGGTIYVVGGVNSPGIMNVPPDNSLTVSMAILQSGGFNRFARKNAVKLISSDSSLTEEQRTQIIDVEAILQRGLRDKDPLVKPNDIIRVEERIIAF